MPTPSEALGFGPAARISMLDVPGGNQRLQVTMPDTVPNHFAGFGISHSSLTRDSSSPESLDVELRASSSVQVHPPAAPKVTSTRKGLAPLRASAPRQPIPHPNGLDAPQIGIEFVLALENPCLTHTRQDIESTDSYGHLLTTHAPLLTHRPQPHEPTSSWTIPAAEIQRLLNLSSQLNLAGEITPVQAWSRIRSYPGFEKLNLDQLETLEKALLKEFQCHGYVDLGRD